MKGQCLQLYVMYVHVLPNCLPRAQRVAGRQPLIAAIALAEFHPERRIEKAPQQALLSNELRRYVHL